MGVTGISAQELRSLAVSPAVRTPSYGAPEQTPEEVALKAPHGGASLGETKQPVSEGFSVASGVRLQVDAETHRIIAQIVDENEQVVRQIPPEDALRIAEKTRELLGLLFDQSA